MDNAFKFNGIFPPVVTLLDQNGEIDYELNKRYLDHLISSGVHGLILLGSSGEFSSLTLQERKSYVKEMVSHVSGRVPVIVGVGNTVLKEVLELVTLCDALGANGVMAVNPYYWKLSDDQLLRYYSTIADHTKMPILLYNIPSFTGQALSIELVAKLASEYENICGIKETVAEIGHIREMIFALNEVRDDFMVFSAFDEHMLPALTIGSAGSINGSAVFAPELSVGLYESYKRGDFEAAQQYHYKLSIAMEIYSYSQSYFTSMKEAVHHRWFSVDAGHRAPFDVFPDELKGKVEKLLQKLQIKQEN
jgi:4-hydroxy-tetrahydrodipicolinate synthase